MDGVHSEHTRRRRSWLPRRGMQRKDGFTLVETMVAMVILSFGLIAMLAMMTAALAGGRVGKHSTDAARIARDQMELFHRLDWTAVAPTGGFTAPTPVVTNVEYGGAAQQEMAYGLSWRITNHPTDTNLRLVDVLVTWTEGDDLAAMAPRRVAMSSVRYNNP